MTSPHTQSLDADAPSALIFTSDYALAYLCQIILTEQGWRANITTEPPFQEVCHDLWLVDLDDARWLQGRQRSFPQTLSRLGITTSLNPRIRWQLIEEGWTDYLIKPFPPSDLIARLDVASFSRRSRWQQIGQHVLDRQAHVLSSAEGGSAVLLTPAEAQLVERLLDAHGKACSLAVLLEHTGGSPNSIRTLIHRLRKVIEPDPSSPRHLLTVCDGYRLIP